MGDLLTGSIENIGDPHDCGLRESCQGKGDAGGRVGAQLPRAAAAE